MKENANDASRLQCIKTRSVSPENCHRRDKAPPFLVTNGRGARAKKKGFIQLNLCNTSCSLGCKRSPGGATRGADSKETQFFLK